MSRIIFFEGTDCAGKGTLIEKTEKELVKRGYTVEVVVEPGCTLSMKETRHTLLNKNYRNMDKLNYLSRRFLYAADHAQLFAVLDFLDDKADYILVDRHTVISDYVYGPAMIKDEEEASKALGISQKIMDCYNEYLEMNNKSYREKSELVFLTITDETLKDRYVKRNAQKGNETDIFDEQSFDFKYKINENYNNLAEMITVFLKDSNTFNNMFEKIHIINANNSPEEVLFDTLNVLNI